MFWKILFACLISVSYGSEIDFTVEIGPSRKECYYETISKGVSVDVEYQVLAFVARVNS